MRDIGTIGRLRWRQAALALLGLGLLWPALVNGGPFLFPDTSAYIRAIDAAAFHATGHRSAWTSEDVERVVAAPAAAPAPGAPAAAADPQPVLLGRSAFYGVLTYLGVVMGSFWATIAAQALVAGAAIVGLVRFFVDPGEPRRFAIAVGAAFLVAAATPLPFFASMLMPDVFTGLGVIAAAALCLGWRRERAIGRLGWFALAGYAALTHSTHILLLGGIGAVAGAVALWRRDRAMASGTGAVLLAAVIGFVGEAAFAHAVASMTGRPAIRPPFLTARLQEDGPATAYLRARCGERRWVLCAYRGRLPQGSDSFLWSADPRTGVFSTVPPAEQRRLAAEQTDFVTAVALDRPIAVVRSSATVVARQFRALGLSEFNLAPQQLANIADQLPAGERVALGRSGAAAGRIPTAAIEWFTRLMLAAAIVAIALGIRSRRDRAVAWLGGVAIGGWLLNDAICGALSTPHDRYQARIVWIVILAGALLFIRLATRWRPLTGPPRVA